MKDPNEMVPMNLYCHRMKDASTPQRLQLLAETLRSKTTITLDDYRRFRDDNDLVFKDEP